MRILPSVEMNLTNFVFATKPNDFQAQSFCETSFKINAATLFSEI